MKGLDLQVGDIPEQIADLERVIIQRVASSVLDNAQILLRAVELVAEIDCFLTFALAAIEYSLVRPTLHNYSIINIKQGRNLIQELLSYSFVPNDTVLGEKQKSLKELKEKQMNIEMEQEQEKDMIESRIEQCDIPSSPCIQFCSMEYKVIKNKQNNKKRGNQFSGSGINTSSIVSSLQQSHSSSMQTLPPHKLESLDDDVIFTYRLIPGRSNVSLSLFCARRAGIPKHIVLRAAEVSSYFTSGHNTIPQMNFLTTKRINNLPFTSRDSGVQQDRYIQAAELFTQLSEEGSSAETILSALQRI
ncbi:MAG: hypothetical protein EZS28_002936 [Streblomastix strix]|uniref:Uncharacterized protein n=1 Tax=Streblomastix strix TaxID=222440 RepID=A0A5J4X2W1_9EUKA|nr:MAG: hypothetical protein EZS28_002936 [Streblomastix strix]